MRIPLGLLLYPFLIYWPLVAFPYLLLDDNWLARGWAEDGYPSFAFISIIQGRPLLAAMAWGSSVLLQSLGFEGIQIFRLLGMAVLGACGLLAYRISERFPLTPPYRVVAALLWITLPANQVIMANGTWLTVGLAAALGGVLLLLRSRNLFDMLCAAGLLIVAAATYQPLFFAGAALYVLTAHDGNWRRMLKGVAVILAAGALYFIMWKLAYTCCSPIQGDNRYNPGSILPMHAWFDRMIDHARMRLGLLGRVWDIPGSWPALSPYLQIAFLGFAGVAAWKSRNWRWLVLIPIALIISDGAVLPSYRWVYSYSTLIGASLVTGFFLAVILSYVFREQIVPAVAIIVLAGIISSISVSRHFAIPTMMDASLIMDHAEKNQSDLFCYIGKTHVYENETPDPAYGFQEFAWSNITPFYAYWHTRTLLELQGRDHTKDVIVVIKDPVKNEIVDVAPAGKRETIDQCQDWLDFSARTKHDIWRRPYQ